MTRVQEIFIDATYSTSKSNTHFYAIVAEELGYSVPLGFMIMEIHDQENTTSAKHAGEAKECNRTFYAAAKQLGLEPRFVHTDKDFSEINAAKVYCPCPPHEASRFHSGMSGVHSFFLYISMHYELRDESSISLCVRRWGLVTCTLCRTLGGLPAEFL
jgi:hypothetical protein